MERFKVIQTYLLFMLILSISLIIGCGGGAETGHWNATGVTKAITAYSLNGVAGTINEPAKTVAVTLPFGTNVTALVATFTTTGTYVQVGATGQVSGATANNFTSPVAYIVTAADGSTATYNVTVTLAPNSAKAITAYSFVGFPAFPGTVNEPAKTIAVTLPFGTNVITLVATFTSTGTSVKAGAAVQTSGATANNFTSPVAYIVTAADGSTATYTVTVTLAPSSLKTITAYSFVGFTAFAGTINEAAKTIAVTLPSGTNLTTLFATFTTTGTGVKVGTTVQVSTATPNDFTSPMTYTVTAADGSTVNYLVTVTITPALSPAKAITAYSFVGFTAFPGTVNEPAKTIAVTLPSGTDVTTLIANFTTTGTGVKMGAVVQTSTATMNNFTSAATYTVTAADGSTVNYLVTVTVTPALSSAKAITAYSFVGFTGSPGTINEAAKTIAVTLPSGTVVTSLTANFTTTGTGVKIGAAVQTSGGAPANNFTSPVTYTVTAADGSTVNYLVTVTVTPALSSAKAITAYSFVGFTGSPGTINEAAKTIAVTLPSGTVVTSLTANFTTTGTGVKIGAAVQTSGGAPANNFTSPVTYTVTAADGSTVNYLLTVTVTPTLSSAKAITAYSFVGFAGSPGTINEAAKTIAVTLPSGTAVTSLTANFTTTGTGVKIGAAVQTSGGAPANNFTSPVTYTVTAADGSTVNYLVTVTVTPALSSAKAITAYSFVGFPGSPGTINEAAKTIAVTLPSGTVVTSLTANFTTTGTAVTIGTAVQTSGGAPVNNFTSPVTYTVTAADGSTVNYLVTVTVTPALSSAKAITAYSFVGFAGSPGTINEAAKTIAVTLPSGTAVTSLTANFTTTGTGVTIGSAVQTSGGTPANSFTSPVTYTVTAADGSTVNYLVTVTLSTAPNLGAASTYGTFGGTAGMTNQGILTIINGNIGTIATTTSTVTGFHDTEGDIFTETGSNIGTVNGTIFTCTNSITGPNSTGVNAAYCAQATQARLDAQTAYLALAAKPSNGVLAGNLAGTTINPGVYTNSSSVLIQGGNLTLDALGDANAVFVFQIGSTLTVGGPGAAFPQSIILAGGAQAKNVFWQVGTFATINAGGGGTMVGTIISQAGVSFSTAGNVALVTLNGRAISLGASVTMVNTVINVPAP